MLFRSRWPKHVTVAVNLSPAQFKSRSIVQTVISALASSGLAAGRLELEITELVLLQETEGAFAILHQLRELGIRIAMDDFGTGYSSLGALKRFPVDNLKVDRSFIQDIPGDRDDAAITKAVIVMAHSLGMKVIAEGVETQEQYKFLREHNCDEMQGFYFSRPLAEPELLTALRHEPPVRKAN